MPRLERTSRDEGQNDQDPGGLNMKTRMLILGLSSCALMIATSQAQGFAMNAATPMPVFQEPQAPPAQTPPAQTSPDQFTTTTQDQSKATTFTGTIVKDGENYVLRDSSG